MEIELKLLLDDAGMRRLRRASAFAMARRGTARSSRLSSIYYDTSSHLLFRHGMALRVRRDGRNWIQTLKGGGSGIGGLHQREEYEWPLGDATLNPDLLALTPFSALFSRPRVRRELAPQFSTVFHRSSVELELAQGTHALLCFDRGTIRAGVSIEAICEVEIELISGEPSAILDFSRSLLAEVPFRVGMSSKAERGYILAARTAPAPQRHAGARLAKEQSGWSGFVACVESATRQVHANEAGFLQGKDPEYLHQMRVGLRRLRVALALPREQAWCAASAPLRARLRELSAQLGEVRNWDMFFAEVLRPMAVHCGAPAVAGLRARAARHRARARAGARDLLLAGDYTAVWIDLALLMNASGDTRAAVDASSLPVLADGSLARRHAQLLKLGAGKHDGKGLHALRITAKKLRYTCDFFAALYPRKKLKRFVAELVVMQDVLGRVQDAVVCQSLIAQAAAGRRELDARNMGLAQGWVAAGEAQALAGVERVVKGFHDTGLFWKT